MVSTIPGYIGRSTAAAVSYETAVLVHIINLVLRPRSTTAVSTTYVPLQVVELYMNGHDNFVLTYSSTAVRPYQVPAPV